MKKLYQKMTRREEKIKKKIETGKNIDLKNNLKMRLKETRKQKVKIKRMKIVVKNENIETEVEVVGVKKKNRFVCQVDLIQRAK